MINQLYSQKLYDKINAWETQFNTWYEALPLTMRPMTTVEYLIVHGPVGDDPEKRAAYNNFMREAQTQATEVRRRYMREVEAYPVAGMIKGL